ncbi:hypothetical protein PF005_g5034 [Phytophthora fragariae]|uniref:Uncharacterized protein n=1 Tax=Phytophthora fragariae TaxID=53985 RepID=A0A6A3M3M1_9STRA|nr:hypothetical protein PF003_g21685 [Phytophthora fragariae]KAE8946283.1 hypothetical protein PF009_g4084 [Phytophthora fragariae]KAE9025027.1 hypothetical protein PF011_g3229 [Phytophthora fragariae]KAE9120033.1 hypothetical protein PF010_g7641 [Phytophthora fragariae]KAE9129405.1 hypothetical protein PF007_g4903 [Phytophthora fragariae]
MPLLRLLLQQKHFVVTLACGFLRGIRHLLARSYCQRHFQRCLTGAGLLPHERRLRMHNLGILRALFRNGSATACIKSHTSLI